MVDPRLALQRLLAIDTTAMANEVLRRHRRRIERLAADCRAAETIVSTGTADRDGIVRSCASEPDRRAVSAE